MKSSFNLRVPGPTPLPSSVLKAVGGEMINHRGSQFEEIYERVVANLKYFFGTHSEIYLITSSGMGGLEASVVNFFSPGDVLLFFTCGEFGHRWAEIARRFGASVIETKFPAGSAVSEDEVYRVLSGEKGIRGVFFTHNETSSGVLNPLSELIPLVHQHRDKPLILVDSISALGAIDLPMDELGIDVLVTASQKAWMAPPGLAMISFSERAWGRHIKASMPRYYFDMSAYKEFSIKSQTPATPAISVLFGLNESLRLMKKEGKGAIFKRHIELRDYFRNEIKKLDLELFVHDTIASPTLTSIVLPDNIDGEKWLGLLRKKYHTVIAGGMGETKGKIVRVAHMGNVNRQDLDKVIMVLKASLFDLS